MFSCVKKLDDIKFRENMTKKITLVFNSAFKTSKERLWGSVNTFSKLNIELSPVLKMTYPKNFKDISFEKYPDNVFVFSSTILLLRFIPIDIYRVRLISVIPDIGFIEESESLFTSSWKHTRKIYENNQICMIEDKLEVMPKYIFFVPIIYLLINIVFKNRHRNLNRIAKSSVATDDEKL